jgi:MoxR-like ATPase
MRQADDDPRARDRRDFELGVRRTSAMLARLTAEIGRVVVGHRVLVERLLIGLLADGHILLEGAPGVAKTLTVKALAAAMNVSFQRIQFTPDLLPADVLGTLIYNPHDHEFVIHRGPIFANLVLADEINRAPAKVQSALLEAMQERTVTLGRTTYRLDPPFLVLATENPIEHEGTYPLPEAQLDRFLMKVKLGYPSLDEELAILRRQAGDAHLAQMQPILTPTDLLAGRQVSAAIHLDETIERYIVNLVRATRTPGAVGLAALAPLIRCGASPRASVHVAACVRAHALLRGRAYALPEDVQAVALETLEHRIVLSYDAENVTAADVVSELLGAVKVS